MRDGFNRARQTAPSMASIRPPIHGETAMTGRRHTTSLKFKTFMFTTALAATVAVGGGALFSGQAWAQASSAAIQSDIYIDYIDQD